MTFGNDRSYGTVWNAGGYMLLVRSNGTIDLMNAKGGVATGTITADFSDPIRVKLVKAGTTINVYINDEERPSLSADGLEISDGFIGLSSDGGTVSFDELTITGLVKSENSQLIDDFSGDLSKWSKTDYPEYSQIKEGVLYTKGVSETPGKGVSPGLVLTNKTFTNAMLSVDIKIDRVALEEN